MSTSENSSSTIAVCWGLGGLVGIGVAVLMGTAAPAFISALIGAALAVGLAGFLQTALAGLPAGHWGPLEGLKGVPGWDAEAPDDAPAVKAAGSNGPKQPVNQKTAAPVADDLKQINGVGPKLEQSLNELGVHGFDQIANWSQDDLSRIDEQLGIRGRVERDNWIEQARELAAQRNAS